MSLTSGLSPRRRLILGFCLLLVVVIIWVVSGELTMVIFNDFAPAKDRPFFATYFETSLFMLYLVGFIFWRPWRRQCLDCFNKPKSLPFSLSESSDDEDAPDIPPPEPLLVMLGNRSFLGSYCLASVDLPSYRLSKRSNPVTKTVVKNLLSSPSAQLINSDPLYVPVKFEESDKEDFMETELHDSQGHVRFSNLMEVRHLAECQADEAMLARMSYQATQAAKEAIIESYKLTVSDVAKISFMFCMVWFVANFSYHKAMAEENPVVLTTAISTSSLFTLLLAGIFPSTSGDRITLTKLVSVLACIAGVFLVVFSKDPGLGDIQLSLIWGMSSSIFYAVYLVMLRRKVDNEDKLDIPMFFGFVGLFNFILIWPGIFVLHYSSYETFEFPSWKVWVYLVMNGLFGTVLSEVLWLWGCFLTSSLIGTLSLSLTIPLTVLVEIFYSDNAAYNLLFFLGSAPVVVSFVIVIFLHFYDDWDPVWIGFSLLLRLLRHLTCWLWQRKWKRKTPEDPEQTERLIGMHNLSDPREGEQDCC